MKYFFKEHAETPLCRKGIVAQGAHITFTVRDGIAELPDQPLVDPALDGKAKARAERHRQLRAEAITEAIREIGGVPVEAEAKAQETAETSGEGEETAETGAKSKKGGKD